MNFVGEKMHFDAWLYLSVNLYISTYQDIYTFIHKCPTYVVKRDCIHAFMQARCIFPSMHGTEVAYTYNPGPILQTTYLHLLYLWTFCICICVFIPWKTSPSWFRHTWETETSVWGRCWRIIVLLKQLNTFTIQI